MSQSPSEPLVDLGFTALEAEVYTRLLDESAATGYRLAQLIGKPAPNVYKALESLEAKGAVMVEDGRRRLCRAMPPDELLGHLDRQFKAARERARRALEERSGPAKDDRIYQLRSFDAVLERARAMLDRAREVAIVDVFPQAAAVLADSLRATAERGVQVAALTYDDGESLPSVLRLPDPEGSLTRDRWPGDWLNVAIDGCELLISYLDFATSSVHQAIWTSSPALAWVYHSALSSEATLNQVEAELAAGAAAEDVKRTIARLKPLQAKWSAGYRQLQRDVVPVTKKSARQRRAS